MTSEMVLAALKGVNDPDLQADIVSLRFVKNLVCTDGRVAFTIELSSPAPRRATPCASRRAPPWPRCPA